MSLSIKNVPDAMAAALRDRAKQHHRSIQGELMAILEAALQPKPELREPPVVTREN